MLRRKVEELESEGENMKQKLKELQDKLTEKTARKNTVAPLASSELTTGNALHEQKLKVQYYCVNADNVLYAMELDCLSRLMFGCQHYL